MNTRAQFKALIDRPDTDVPLAEAALCIAAETRPQVDVSLWMSTIEQIADRISPHLELAASPLERLHLLNEGLFIREGFVGNSEDYSNPENSFLDSVLESRKGIPITLSIIYMEVARRLGFNSFGIGFPGHFLVGVKLEQKTVVIDPFSQRILEQSDCEKLLFKMAGQKVPFNPLMLSSTPTKEILQRVLRNLKMIYVAKKEYESALSCSDRILLLADEDLSELRDRGLLYRELECAGPALKDLEQYISLSPPDPNIDALKKIVQELRDRVQAIH
ncbi:MAG: hypothetical protein CL917_11865 [Deltaproteobacteria bacterium]|nr:hypothetical protein [Deltaproteobacteria bacterium]